MSIKKKRTIFSMVSRLYVIVQSLLGIFALVAHEIALNSSGDRFQFWHNKIWSPMSQWLGILPIILALPYLIFNIIGMFKEKRVIFFVVCMAVSFFSWLYVMAIATAYF